MNKTAVVFGATGLVGKELVSELLLNSAYEKITAVVRKKMPVPDPKFNQVVISDFSEIKQQADKLQATDYFCCIGTTIRTAGSQEAFRKVDFDIPLQIAGLAQELSVSCLVVISSIGAKSDTSNFYLRTKGEMEQSVRNVYNGNLKIVRPSLLMGNRQEFRRAERISIWMMKLINPLLIGPAKKYRGIDVTVVAKAMIKATLLPVGKVFIESDELHDLSR
jgi:uncharacterized protein YbjT (DUF2867 family)